jgi:hypothetical protein
VAVLTACAQAKKEAERAKEEAAALARRERLEREEKEAAERAAGIVRCPPLTLTSPLVSSPPISLLSRHLSSPLLPSPYLVITSRLVSFRLLSSRLLSSPDLSSHSSRRRAPPLRPFLSSASSEPTTASPASHADPSPSEVPDEDTTSPALPHHLLAHRPMIQPHHLSPFVCSLLLDNPLPQALPKRATPRTAAAVPPQPTRTRCSAYTLCPPLSRHSVLSLPLHHGRQTLPSLPLHHHAVPSAH